MTVQLKTFQMDMIRLDVLGRYMMENKKIPLENFLLANACASAIFGCVHGMANFIKISEGYKFWEARFDGVIVLVYLELIQSIVFFIFSTVIIFFPVIDMSLGGMQLTKTRALSWGFFLATLSIPLCAAFAYSIFPDPDGPSYLARCKEFALPMMAAGLVGGYTFWRTIKNH